VSLVQALVLAVLQGFSELFPISSLGHTVLVPAYFHWNIDRADPGFLAFVVALHLGTALALVVFYWSEWVRIVRALVASVVRGEIGANPDERLAWLLVIGTLPVGILGVFLEKMVRHLFGSTAIVAGFLIVNAGVMFLGERLQRRQHEQQGRGLRPLEKLSWSDAVKVGFAQALALFPGISRSGVSIVAGILLDLDHEAAAHYAFLLATPVIGAASLLELPRLFEPAAHDVLWLSVGGAVISGITAYASVAFLTRYFRSNDLRPFGWYCLGAGLLSLLLLFGKVIS
jgi:undecaprenyl-diphosphatase